VAAAGPAAAQFVSEAKSACLCTNITWKNLLCTNNTWKDHVMLFEAAAAAAAAAAATTGAACVYVFRYPVMAVSLL
jgi:hypothetical protein